MTDPNARMSSDQVAADCIDAAARFLAAEPASVTRALATHQRGPDGRCTRCGPGQRWPCAVAASARLAHQRLQQDAARTR